MVLYSFSLLTKQAGADITGQLQVRPIFRIKSAGIPPPLPPSPSTVRARDHTVLYCTIVLYSTKKEYFC